MKKSKKFKIRFSKGYYLKTIWVELVLTLFGFRFGIEFKFGTGIMLIGLIVSIGRIDFKIGITK